MPIIIPFILVVMFAFALYALADVNPSAAPLVSIVTLVNISILCALFNVLQAGVWASYILAAVAFVFAVYKSRKNITEKIRGFMSPGVMLFVVSAVAMFVCLYTTQPMVHLWDEYSFWGTSRKLVKTHNQLYTYYKSSLIGNSTPPALSVLTYFFQMTAPQFTEWAMYFAYDVLFLACFSAFTAAFDRKNGGSAAAVFLTAVAVSYFFSVTVHSFSLSSVYISAYADLPLALLTAGAIAVYLAEKDGSRAVTAAALVIMFTTFTKDMGFALSCIVAFVVFFDMLVARNEFSFLKIKGFFGKCTGAAVMLAVAGGSFFGWSAHMARVMQRNPFELGGETNMSQVQMLLTGVKELLIGPQSEKFVTIRQLMTEAFFNIKLSMIGSGVVIFGFITILFAASVIFGGRKNAKANGMMYLTTLVGFVGYYVFHLFLYVYIFKDNAYTLTSYDRYIGTYYTAWLLVAIVCLARSASGGRAIWSKACLVGLMCCMLAVSAYYIRPENLFTSVHRLSFPVRRSVAKKVEFISDAVNKDDVICVYSGEDTGEIWFAYCYEMTDNYIIMDSAYTAEGATEEETKLAKQQEMKQRFEKYGVTHFLVDYGSVELGRYFAQLFNDEGVYCPAEGVGRTMVSYYKVNYTDDGISFDFVKGGVVDYD